MFMHYLNIQRPSAYWYFRNTPNVWVDIPYTSENAQIHNLNPKTVNLPIKQKIQSTQDWMTSTYVFKSSGWVLCHNAFPQFAPDSTSTNLKLISKCLTKCQYFIHYYGGFIDSRCLINSLSTRHQAKILQSTILVHVPVILRNEFYTCWPLCSISKIYFSFH